MNEHLLIEEKELFLRVTCTEGHYITNWDGENILKYASAKVMYCPKTIDLSKYYCLTEEEHEANIKALEEAIKLEEENNRKKHELK